MSDANHPIWSHFMTNPDNSLTCSECGYIYRKLKETTLKNHYILKHPDIWKNIRKNERNGKYKGKK